ncbi:hypothetical protein N7527_009153 [Penicillium freii]|nr:hypothetical protein N7527_009153 [Penicillium freii]
MGRIIWLDGLRGIASAIVVLCHATLFEPRGTLDFLDNSYWDEPPEQNRHLIQLPPVRLLYDGSSMVSLFMVISGYAISIPVLTSRKDKLASLGFFRRLCSAATRRIFRIYTPSILVVLLTHLLYFCNFLSWEPPSQKWLSGLDPLTAPWSHAFFVIRRLLHLLDISNQRIDLNFGCGRWDIANLTTHLWTMPVEFRGSCTIYLLILTLAHWKLQSRLNALKLIGFYWLYMGQWDLFAFVAGLFLAEGHVALDSHEADREVEVPCHIDRTWKVIIKARNVWKRVTLTAYFHQAYTMACFILGMFFLCVSNGVWGCSERLLLEYQFLHAIKSPNWDDMEMFSRCWKTIGAVLVVYAISRSAILQRPLNSRIVQYLGKVSFSLYLVHVLVFLIVEQPLRNRFLLMITGTPYSGAGEANDHTRTFIAAWAGFVLVSGPILVSAADIWNRLVDIKCIEMSRRFEKWVTK